MPWQIPAKIDETNLRITLDEIRRELDRRETRFQNVEIHRDRKLNVAISEAGEDGRICFTGKDTAMADVNYGALRVVAVDKAPGSEDAYLSIKLMAGGSLVEKARLEGDAFTHFGTGGIVLPVGTDAQRLATQGTVRYNTTGNNFEGYDGATWQNLQAGAGGGEANTMSNDGTGLATFNAKSGANFPMRGANAPAAGGLSIAYDAVNKNLDFSIANAGVTFAKIQNINQNEILGRASAAAGSVEALTAAQVRTIINVEDGAQVNAVTSVAGKTGAVTLVEADITDLQNYALASHSHGLADLTDVVSATNTTRFALMANGTTGYVGRAIVEADISDLQAYAVSGGAYHDGFSDFVADEHVAHSGVTMTIAGTANQISSSAGAQSIAASRTWTLSLASNPVIPGNGGIIVPVGTDAQRQATQGSIRYNTTGANFEGYDGSSWKDLQAGGGSGFTPLLFTADKTSSFTIPSTEGDVTGWTAADKADSGFSWNNTTGVLTLQSDGWYLINATFEITYTAGTRDTGNVILNVGGTNVCTVGAYARTASGSCGATITWMVQRSSTDLALKFRAVDGAGSANIQNITAARFTVVKLA